MKIPFTGLAIQRHAPKQVLSVPISPPKLGIIARFERAVFRAVITVFAVCAAIIGFLFFAVALTAAEPPTVFEWQEGRQGCTLMVVNGAYAKSWAIGEALLTVTMKREHGRIVSFVGFDNKTPSTRFRLIPKSFTITSADGEVKASIDKDAEAARARKWNRVAAGVAGGAGGWTAARGKNTTATVTDQNGNRSTVTIHETDNTEVRQRTNEDIATIRQRQRALELSAAEFLKENTVLPGSFISGLVEFLSPKHHERLAVHLPIGKGEMVFPFDMPKGDGFGR